MTKRPCMTSRMTALVERPKKYWPFYNGPFCQWTYSPFIVNSRAYECAEQYMMARKALLFGDTKAFAAIMASDDPAEQKQLGRFVEGFNKQVWEAVAWDVVTTATLAKFTQDARMHTALEQTRGYTLVEASPTDRIWGVGLYEHDPAVHNSNRWNGRNWLGYIITDVRLMLMGD